MTEKVSIQLDAIDNASNTIGQFFNVIQSGAVGGEMAFGLLQVAAQSVVTFVQGSVDGFLQYTETVKDFARNTGMSVEESSRLIQMADDVRLSTESLSTAFKILEKNGMSPSIETMKKLADQYVALQSPAERAQFLMSNFGKSGMEMGKLLEGGSAGLDKLNGGINENLVLTQEAIVKAELYKRTQDNLNDSFQALQMSVGEVAIEPLTIGIKALTDYVEKATSSWKGFFDAMNPVMQIVNLTKAGFDSYNKTQQEYTEIAAEATKATAEQGGTVEKTKAEWKAEEEAIKAVTKANTDLLSLSQTIQQANDSYAQKLAELTAKQNEQAANIASLSVQYGTHSQKVQEMTDKYNETTASIQKLEQEHTQAMNKIAFDLMVTKLKADGFTDAEYQMALQAGKSLGIIDEASAETAKNMDLLTQAAANSTDGAQKLGAILSKAMSDGKLTSSELQDALNQLNTVQPQTSVENFNADLVTSNTNTQTLGEKIDSVNGKEMTVDMTKTNTALDDALTYATNLKDKLDELDNYSVDITVNYTTNGTPPTTGGNFKGFTGETSGFAPLEGNGFSRTITVPGQPAQAQVLNNYFYAPIVVQSPDTDPANLLEAFRG